MSNNVFEQVLNWLRAGYPQGIPEGDYIALFGVLHRHLTPEEVEHIAQELYRGEGGLDSAVPADEIRRQIQATVHEKPAESDVRRVAARLAKGGWPLVPVKELND